jgi:membrane-associated protease RseP (regulator of RpoE activity)
MMPNSKLRTVLVHGGLFLITLITTTIAGAEWATGKLYLINEKGWNLGEWMHWREVKLGLMFSLPFLGILTVHEFGHYFAARHHKVRVTLPFYLPLFLGFTNTMGTLGAYIRIKSRVFSRKEYFDIGLAGPLAGFLVAVPLLVYGFLHLPPPEYIFLIHPEYADFGLNYAEKVYQSTGFPNLILGKNLLFWILETTLADPERLPNSYELMHYPLLFAGYLALFFTALNLLPIGQLDGGHIGYAALGYERFNRLAGIVFTLLVTYAGLGVIDWQGWTGPEWYFNALFVGYLLVVLRKVVPTWRLTFTLTGIVLAVQLLIRLVWPVAEGYPGWLAFGLILSRFLGVYHPPAPNEDPISTGRKVLAVVALLILILCYSPAPFRFE